MLVRWLLNAINVTKLIKTQGSGEPMNQDRQGIVIAGNILADIVKSIDTYPEIGMLANIFSVSKAVGGCVPNTAIDLAKIDSSLQLSVRGCVGDDEYGHFVLSQLRENNIDTKNVRITKDAPTSFSDVMSLSNGERTFFHARGANALFSPEEIDISKLKCAILHTGYLLLLDQFDRKDSEYGTAMARFLHDVQERGIKTSIDVVSDSSADFPNVIIPALKFCDYVIINEIECGNIWRIEPRNENGSLRVDAIRDAMEKTLAAGVREKVIVHSKEAGFCLSRNGDFSVVSSLLIPPREIKGSVGAGDAFCAGCLYGIYEGYTDSQILEFASAAAACNLFAANAVDGMRSRDEIYKIMQTYPRRATQL